jgi:hypothetical protein
MYGRVTKFWHSRDLGGAKRESPDIACGLGSEECRYTFHIHYSGTSSGSGRAEGKVLETNDQESVP